MTTSSFHYRRTWNSVIYDFKIQIFWKLLSLLQLSFIENHIVSFPSRDSFNNFFGELVKMRWKHEEFFAFLQHIRTEHYTEYARITDPYKTDFDVMRKLLEFYNLSEGLMIQNQIKSVKFWDSFKSEIHEVRNGFVPKQPKRMPSWKINCSGSKLTIFFRKFSFDSPENIRKPDRSKGYIGKKRVNQVVWDAIRNKSKVDRRLVSSKNMLSRSDV